MTQYMVRILMGIVIILAGMVLNTGFVKAQCPVSTFPYSEDFDNASPPNLPCGWKVTNNNGDQREWISAPSNPNSSPNAVRIRYNTTLAMDDWFFTPELQLQGGTTYELQFAYRANSSNFTERLEVLWGSNQNAGAMTDTLFDNANITNTAYVTVTRQFTTPSSDSIHIGFHGYSAADQDRLFVDDVQIQELSQQCPKPTNLTTSNYTATTADVQWSANSSNSFDVEYGPSGFSLGAGTSISGGQSTSVTLSGLSADTTYDVYVRQICGQDTSNFAGPETFVLNDSCQYAVPAACNATIDGTTNGATTENVTGTTCGTSIDVPGVWYTFTGTGSQISATTCSQLTTFDTKISVFEGSCGNLVCVGGNDDIGPQCPFGNNYSQVSWSSTQGKTYYILVHGANGGQGDFQLTVNTQSLADAGTDDTTCQGDTTTLTATGGTDYNWNTGDTTASIDVGPLTTTDYVVTVSTTNGCSDSDTVQVVATDSTDGGTVMTESGEDTVNVCIDNSPGIVAFDSMNNATNGASYSYIITNASNDTILGAPGSDQKDFNPSGPGECHVWGVSHVGSLNAQPGLPVSDLSATYCFELSNNYIVVYRDSVDSGSDIQVVDDSVTSDTTQICIDNNPDTLSFTNNSGATANTEYSYVATDQNNNILASFDSKADFNAAGTGVCFVYGVSYVGNLNAQQGQSISSVSASVCSDVSSDYAVVLRDSVDGGTVSLENGDDTATVCLGSPNTFLAFDSTTQATQGADYTYLITNAANTIVLSTLPGDAADVSGAPAGEYHIWGASHVGELDAGQQTPVSNITADECYELSSNFVTVFVDSATVDAGPNDTVCQGNTASLTASGNGSLEWSNGSSNTSISVSPATTTDYTVTVTTQDGCTAVDTATVVVNQNPAVSLNDPTICPGSSTALDAGNPGASYIWNTQAQTQTITVSQAGDYSVTVTQNGCTGSDTATVTIGQGLSVSLDDDTICQGDTVTLDAGFPGSNFVYGWSTGDSTQTIQVAPTVSDDYSVTVTDTANNCFGEDTATVQVNSLPTADAGQDQQICKGDSATLTATGGDTYAWSNNANGASITVGPQQTTGYTVTVTASNGCTATDEVVVSVNDTSVSLNDQSICQGDSATLDPGAQWADYAWSTNDTTATITIGSAGNYAVTVTDNLNGCTATDTTQVTVSSSLNVDLGGDYEICQGESVTLDAGLQGSVYVYNWSNGASTQTTTVSSGDTYSVTVTDTSSGCSGADTSSVTVNPLPNADAGSDAVICEGESTTLQASGGFDYAWSTGDSVPTVSVSPTQTSTYTVTAIDTNGCTATDDVTVAVNPNPAVNLPDPSICSGSSTTLNAGNPGSNYIWSTSETTQTISVSQPGDYAVTVIDTNNCTGSDTATVTIGNNLTVDVGGDYEVCPGDSVTLDAGNPGATYNWSTGQGTQTITVGNAGTYSVTVTDNNNCSGTDTSDVTVRSAPVADAGSDQQICAGESTTLSASGGATYDWSNNQSGVTISVLPTTSTSYTVTVTDTAGCSSTDDVLVDVSQGPSVSIDDDSICAGSSTTLDAGSSGSSYLWSTNETTQTITVSSAGTYSVTVTDSAGCTAVDTADVTASSNFSVNLGSPTACQGNSVTLDAGNPGAQYSWNTGATSQTISVDSSGVYWVTVVDGNCTGSDTTTINLQSTPTADAGENDTICPGESATLSASGGDSYAWSNNDSSATITVSPSNTSIYTVTVTNNNGCSATDNATVVVGSEPTANAGPDKEVCEGDTVTLTASGGVAYAWDNGATSASITVQPAFTQNYNVTVTNSFGCEDTDAAKVTVNNLPSVSLQEIDTTICVEASSVVLNGTPAGGTYSGTAVTDSLFTPSVAGTGTFDLYYTYTDNNNCSNTDTTSVTVDVCQGIEELSGIDKIGIYPNPFSDQVNLAVNATAKSDLQIEVTDITGQTILQKQETVQTGEQTITLNPDEKLAGGLYYLTVQKEEEKRTFKLIRSR